MCNILDGFAVGWLILVTLIIFYIVAIKLTLFALCISIVATLLSVMWLSRDREI